MMLARLPSTRALARAVSILLLASAVTVCHATPSGRRLVAGGAIAEHLYQVACRADAGPWRADFSEERFTLVGALRSKDGTTFQVALLSTVWGPAGRATNRLLIFSADGHYLGRYSGLSSNMPPSIISATAVKFPVPPKHGGEIQFSAGPPASILIEGDLLSYEPVDLSAKGANCDKLGVISGVRE